MPAIMATDSASTSTASGSSTSSAATASDVARLVLESRTSEHVVVSIPGTSYRLTLTPTVPPQTIPVADGKRLLGVLRGKAQQMHVASAGGRFIEPVYGHPRIVQGTIQSIDRERNRVLVQMVVPAWLDVAAGQSASEFVPGQLVNMYVESGMTITPVG